ncbi:ferrochelatase [Paenalcaligenes niemegkensis]|uniref:ferrochelatase n=1 Tax=Paenalcaligenes niemegkensis TaxID=2895469 RepID=UPI001EE87374|nr:ferrochelatase [Paenalcaligenes niemegkensis]MCQ9617005.1 ferrochelatase [Paenalcaligenes niemegkensis]
MLLTKYLDEAADPTLLDSEVTSRPEAAIGVLLLNLGTPDAPTAPAIRRYLDEFLSDPRVIEIPQVLWQLILRLAVLPFRPKKLVPKYELVWMEEGAPLLVYSQRQAEGLEAKLKALQPDIHVELVMRYGNPSIPAGIQALRDKGCEKILVAQLYPQYAASTTATAVDAVNRHVARLRNQPELRFIKNYYDDPGYIQPLAQSVRRYWAQNGTPERLLLSFHGLPRRCIEQGDPYYRECMLTASALRKALADTHVPVYASFQSRFGAERWLEPYTEPLLRQWAKEGVRSVHTMCPGFLADCLETLEEIQVECRDAFIADGGEHFGYISCLNDDPQWIDGLSHIVLKQLGGWVPDSDKKLA